MRTEIYSENTNTLLFTAFDSIKYRKTDSYRLHHHAELELGYICEGEGLYILADQTFHAKAGDLFLVRPNEQHCVPTITSPELRSYNFYITSYYLWNVCSEYLKPGIQSLLIGDTPIIHCFSGKSKYVEQIRALCEQETQPRAQDLGKIRFLMLSLMESITEEMAASQRYEKSGSTVTAEHLNGVQKAIQYINNHLTEDVSLEQLAKCTNLSRTYFSVIFKQVTGVTPYEYLILRRIEHSLELLRGQDVSIAEVASRCGFNSITNFNRLFKNATGMAPREYRNSKGMVLPEKK